LLSALLFAACVPTAFAAPSYSLTFFSPNPGYSPGGINNNGLVGGGWYMPDGASGAFTWQAGQLTHLPQEMYGVHGVGPAGHVVGHNRPTMENGVEVVRGAVYYQGALTILPDAVQSPYFHYTQAYAANASGTVVASTENSYGATSFLWNNGTTTLLPIDYATAINASGNVAGYSSLDEGVKRAQLVINGQLVELGLLPTDLTSDRRSAARDLNDANVAVGSSTYGSGSALHEHSFIYVNGQMQVLGSYTGDNSAIAINNLGDVVGRFSTGWGLLNDHAYLYQDGVQYDLDTLLVGADGWHIRLPTDINDHGDITALACDVSNVQCLGVLLSPVPEPATYGMLLAGLGVLGWARRRQSGA
jgi:probable HAF family extracellular repeat protein